MLSVSASISGKMKFVLWFSMILTALPGQTYAHHGRKYLVTSSHQIAEPGSVYGLFSSDLRSRLGQQASGIEPGILFGLTHQWEMEVHTHHAFEDGLFRTEAVGIESRLGLFGSFSEEETGEEDTQFGAAFLAEFEKGLHEHGDSFEGRLIVGGTISSLPIAANLIWHGSFGDETSSKWRYALGMRKNIVPSIDVGLEFQGNFDGSSDASLTPGAYISATKNLDIKLGASLGSNSSTSGQTVHLALVYGL